MMVVSDYAADDVFVSYKRERRAVAEHVANVIRAHGYSVWYDYDLIPGHDFAPQIERRVREAKIVLVLWCTQSVTSPWVLKEATLGRERGLLAPMMIEPCEPPDGFGGHHFVKLSEWDGSPRSHLLDPLWDLIEARTGREPTSMKPVRAYERTWRSLNAASLPALIRGTDARHLTDTADPNALVVQAVSAADGGPGSSGLSESDRAKLVAASKMWIEVRDTADVERLTAFENLFTETHFAVQARALRLVLEQASLSPSSSQATDEQIDRLQDQGRIGLAVHSAHGAPILNGQGWFLPREGTRSWFKDHPFGPEMVVIPAGEFTMGSNERPGEAPAHSVVIARPFAVSRFPITFQGWDAAEKQGHLSRSPDDMGWGRSTRPVIDVSWHDAVAYCGWLSRATGLSYRLLSEAEWEYAARAGTTTRYWKGDTIADCDANFDHSPSLTDRMDRRRTVPVDTFAPNPWGLYQTQGNVWEWVADTWRSDYRGASGNTAEWRGEDDCRVVRGGSWSSSALALRSANRERFPVDHRDYNVGFRIMRSI